MGVLDGQPVNAAITNPAFINKNQDDVMPNILGFSAPFSGPSIDDIQQSINNLFTASGVSESTTGTNYNATPGTISNGQNYETALRILANKFDAATGHVHTGLDGDAPPISAVLTIAATGYDPITGSVYLAAGAGTQVYESGQTIFIAATGHTDSIAVSGNSPIHGDVVLVAGTGVQLSQLGQNITISATGAGGGGGGGGSLDWVEGLDSPTPFQEYGNWTYLFDSSLSQQLTTSVKVPNNYNSGTQIFLRSLVYSSDTTGNLLFQTVATLIRTGTDAISSTTNQRTSTNSAITLGAGTVNKPQAVSFDLTSSSGQINGVSVSAGDLILITLKRGTDTSTVTARSLVFASEMNFS